MRYYGSIRVKVTVVLYIQPSSSLRANIKTCKKNFFWKHEYLFSRCNFIGKILFISNLLRNKQFALALFGFKLYFCWIGFHKITCIFSWRRRSTFKQIAQKQLQAIFYIMLTFRWTKGLFLVRDIEIVHHRIMTRICMHVAISLICCGIFSIHVVDVVTWTNHFWCTRNGQYNCTFQ